MTYGEVKEQLESIGLPLTYYEWPDDEEPELPYLVYYYPERDDFKADDINYIKKPRLNIELYTEEKDFDLENRLEAILEQYGFSYAKEEQYIESERMYEVLYVTEVIING